MLQPHQILFYFSAINFLTTDLDGVVLPSENGEPLIFIEKTSVTGMVAKDFRTMKIILNQDRCR